jgi:osmotically inducible protein OsmC
MSELEKFLHTAKTHTVGGVTGTSRSSDGTLDITLSMPGSPGTGTTPEQLFAAAWSARFMDALHLGARSRKLALPPDLAVDAEVDLWLAGQVYVLEGRLSVHLPGLKRESAQSLVDTAKATCPYFKALRNDVDVVIELL